MDRFQTGIIGLLSVLALVLGCMAWRVGIKAGEEARACSVAATDLMAAHAIQQWTDQLNTEEDRLRRRSRERAQIALPVSRPEAEGERKAEVSALVLRCLQPDLSRRYGALFARLAISDTQLNSLRALLAQRTLGVTGDGHHLSDGASVDEIQAFSYEIDRTARDILGQSGYEQYQAFSKTLLVTNVLNHWKNLVTIADGKISPSDTATLTNLLSKTESAGFAPHQALSSRQLLAEARGESEIQIDALTLSRAGELLSRTQYSALKGIQQLQQQTGEIDREFGEPAR